MACVDSCIYDVERKKKVTNRRCGIFLCGFYALLFIGAFLAMPLMVFVGKKGWTVEHGLHTTTFKITGTAKDNRKPPRVWEAADLEDPPEQSNAFFLTTKMERVPNQKFQSLCSTNRKCIRDEDCKSIGLNRARGRQRDGECVLGGFCMVPDTWCPLPDDQDETSFDVRSIQDLSKISVVIRNTVFFPKAKKNITNVNADVNDFNCTYNKGSDKWCPVFTMNRILNEVGIKGEQAIHNVVEEGAIIATRLIWNCNQKVDDNCELDYRMSRIDRNPDRGYSYETTHDRFDDNGEEKRDWLHSIGILVTVDVESTYSYLGDKWDILWGFYTTLTYLSTPSTVMVVFFCVMKVLGMVSKRRNWCKNFLSCRCSTEANDEIMFWEDEHTNEDIK